MAGSVNKVILVGNLGKDPEIRKMGSGEPVVNLSLATTESWRDKATGEKKEKTEWHRVVIFNENIAKISNELTRWAQEKTRDSPFEILNVVVGNIQYPAVVAQAVANKLAVSQDLETRATQVEIARKDAERRVVEAEGIARATQIIQQRLTPLYVQHEAIEAQKATVNSPNHTTVYIPVGPMGVPLVNTTNAGEVR